MLKWVLKKKRENVNGMSPVKTHPAYWIYIGTAK